MSELRFHPGDPRRRPRSIEIGPLGGALLAGALIGAGTLAVLGLAGAPDLVSDLVRSADRLALRETARRGSEAFASVSRRAGRLAGRIASDELFLARVATLADVPLPAGFPGDAVASRSADADDVESGVGALGRRLRAFELLRRRVATLSAANVAHALQTPSRSPVEPSSAVPVELFGPHESPWTHRQEFFPGLALATPAGAAVSAPAAGMVLFAGPVPKKIDSSWRRLGVVVVLAHGDGYRTVYGHVDRVAVRRGARVTRGDLLARVGTSGFAATPRLHYEVRRPSGGAWLPVDPRLYVLDVDWIAAPDVRSRPPAPAELDLPSAFE